MSSDFQSKFCEAHAKYEDWISDGNEPSVSRFLECHDYGSDVAAAVEDQTADETSLGRLVKNATKTGPANIGLESKSSSDISSPDLADQQIDGYKFKEEIGSGAMGHVWLAEQTALQRDVAIKFLRSHESTSNMRRRFVRECQTLSQMEHENIAKVYDSGILDNGVPYLVMEFIDGQPIVKFCNKKRLSIDDRLQLFMDVCRGITHAHQKLAVHRDLKPANILVQSQDGIHTPKIIDFGLAKILEKSAEQRGQTTHSYGIRIGTIEYMSPEQASGNSKLTDTRSDVYSLGVLLYELLTGIRPIDRKKLSELSFHQIIEEIRSGNDSRPSVKLASLDSDERAASASERQLNPEAHLRKVQGDLDWIVVKALEVEPDDRYDSASDFAADVARYLNGEPVKARQGTAGYVARKFISKYRSAIGITILIASVLIAAMVMTVRSRNDAIRALAKEELATTTANEAKFVAEKALARSKFQLARSHLRDGRIYDAEMVLQQIPERHRHLEWQITRSEIEKGHRTLYGHTLPVFTLDVDPSGNQIVSAGWDNRIRIWDLESGELLQVLPPTNP
jgi:serine/threonine protein kinase